MISIFTRLFTTFLFSFFVTVAVGQHQWTNVSAGGYHTLALKNDSTLWAWGADFMGQVGSGFASNALAPVNIGGSSKWKAFSAGHLHSLAIKSDGTIWGWGSNGNGELGNCSYGNLNTPTQIGSSNDWKVVSSGERYSLAIKNDGSLWAWGVNSYGQLAYSNPNGTCIPTQIGTEKDWVNIKAGKQSVLALKKDSSLWSWGDNSSGQLGTGTNSSFSTIPLQVGIDKWIAISAGDGHSLGIKSNGSIYAWGSNYNMQVGTGFGNYSSPVQIGADSNWIEISAGTFRFSLALNREGTLWAWGNNAQGQLGSGNFDQINSPEKVDSGVKAISSGYLFSSIIHDDGNAICFTGSNEYGQFGNGTSSNINSNIFTCANMTTLPVKLNKFSVYEQAGIVKLEWTIPSESSSNYFIVERSGDGRYFKELITLKASTSTAISSNYNTSDKAPISGKNYYRLKIVDNAGRFDYSKIIEVDIRSNISIKISPHPVHTNAIVTIKGVIIKGSIGIYTIYGNKVKSYEINNNSNSAPSFINIEKGTIASGIYYYRLSDERGLLLTTGKIIFQ